MFTAGCTFLLLIAGALVTSNDAGLSIPDWPLAYGQVVPHLSGGARYEFTHRAMAGSVGLLTIALTALLWKYEPQRWVRNLGLVALGAVIAQAILGGLTVRMMQPPAVSAAHATLAQLFFSTVIALSVFTGRWWQSSPAQLDDSGSPALWRLGAWTIAAVFVQLVLGAAFRHKAFGIVPHLVGAAVVTALIFWLAGALKRRFPRDPTLTRCRIALHALIGSQLLLGGAAWWSRIYAREFPQPIGVMVALTVTHTVVGALVLGGALVVTLICYRLVRSGREVVLASHAEQVGHPASL